MAFKPKYQKLHDAMAKLARRVALGTDARAEICDIASHLYRIDLDAVDHRASPL